MGFFALGIEKIKIHKIYEFIGKGEVRFHSFVSDRQLTLPGAQALLNATSASDRKDVVMELATDVISRWESITIDNVKEGHSFEFGDTGRILYRSDSIPQSLDWFMLAIEDDQKVRDLGSRLEEFFSDDRVDKVTGAINTLVTGTSAVSPGAAAGIVLGKTLLSGMTFLMKRKKDDLLAIIEQSFIRQLHYPTGTRYKKEVQDLTANAWYDYFIYGSDESIE